MDQVLHWPAGLAPRSVMHRQAGATVMGPVSLSGRSQTVRTDAGYWELTVNGVQVGGPAKVAAWRAFLTSMEGGTRGAYVPAWDYDQAPWPNAGSLGHNTNIDNKFSDGTTYSDGTGFYDPAIKVYLNGPHLELATTITVTVTAAGTIRAGQVFSLLQERLHVIREVLSATSWSIWPPLRRDYVSGVALEFGRPVLKATLASPADGNVDLSFGRYGQASMVFRELI